MYTCKSWTQLGYSVNLLFVLKTRGKACFRSLKHCTCKTLRTQIGHMVNIFIVLKTLRKAGFRWWFGTLFHTILNKISVLTTHWKACVHRVKHCIFKTKWTQLVSLMTILTLMKTQQNASFRSIKHYTCKSHWLSFILKTHQKECVRRVKHCTREKAEHSLVLWWICLMYWKQVEKLVFVV